LLREIDTLLSQTAAAEAAIETLFSFMSSVFSKRTTRLADETLQERVAISMDKIIREESLTSPGQVA